MANKTYYLVLYDVNQPRGVNFAFPSILDEQTAEVILREDSPVIHRKKGGKFKVIEKRLFEYSNIDGSKTLFIIVDATRYK